MSNNESFVHKITVRSEDIDVLKHVNNVVYLRYAQEVAQEHWKYKTNEVVRDLFVWVVVRHEIDYLHPSFEGNELLGSTWLELPKGSSIVRNVSLFNNSLQKATANVKSTWCLLDAITLRPKRIDESVWRLFRQ